MPTKVSPGLVKLILAKYQLLDQLKQIESTQSGYRNTIVPVELLSGKKLSLIFYKPEPDILKKIKNANQVSNFLADLGWPVRKTIASSHNSILKITRLHQTHYCCVYNYLSGATINWENYTMKHIKLLGQVLGYLHHDLKKFQPNSANLFNNEILNLEQKIKEMSKYFCNNNVKQACEQKLKLTIFQNTFVQFEQLLSELKKSQQSQLLHLDFVRSNLLFDKQPNLTFLQQPQQIKFAFAANNLKKATHLTITGILDFEKTAYGPPILDLARTLAFLLVDCKYKTPDKIQKYFLYSGYLKRGQQTLPDLKLLKQLIFYFLHYDFYKFLCHNPYESLPLNQHFVRTRDFLLTSGFIQQSN